MSWSICFWQIPKRAGAADAPISPCMAHATGLPWTSVTSSRGIYKSQMKMLGYIFHHEGVSQRELATQLQISAPSIAVTAKKLEKMGYIRRHMDEKDNRHECFKYNGRGKSPSRTDMESLQSGGCAYV